MENKKGKAASLLRTMYCIKKSPMRKADIIPHIKDPDIIMGIDILLKFLIKEGFVTTSISGGTTYYKVVVNAIKIVYVNGNSSICNIGSHSQEGEDNCEKYASINGNTSGWIDLIKTLNNYKNDLDKLYMHKKGTKFDLDLLLKVSGFNLTNKGQLRKASFAEHLKLKNQLRHYITNVNRKDVFFWIVYDWGGVKKNKYSSVASFDNAYKNANGNMAQLVSIFASQGERVASWSKILSFLYPEECFIYDRRVAFTLDFLLGKRTFPIPRGENKIIESHVISHGQPNLKDYIDYCQLIKKIHFQLCSSINSRGVVQGSPSFFTASNINKPYLTEMLIFALIEDLGFCAGIPDSFKI